MRRPTRRVVIGLGGLALVAVVAVAVVVVAAVQGGGSTGSPQEAAEGYVDAFNARDAEALRQVICAQQRENAEILTMGAEQACTELELRGPVTGRGGAAAIIEDDKEIDVKLRLEPHREGSRWTVCTS